MTGKAIKMSLNSSKKLTIHAVIGLVALVGAAQAEMVSGTAVVQAVRGVASYVDQLGGFHPLVTGTALKSGCTIRTGAGSSVDLTMESNGRTLQVLENSELAFTKLSFEPSPLGNIFDTELNLKQGKMFANVSKLLAGARYEVTTPQGVAKVRGTEFWFDAKGGLLWVLNGTVHFEVWLNSVLVPPPPGSHAEFQTIDVSAGQRLLVPKEINMINFRNGDLTPLPYAGPYPPVGFIASPSGLSGHYANGGNTQVTVQESWFTKLDPKKNTVDLIGIPGLVVPSP